jgi:hypothetical protein
LKKALLEDMTATLQLLKDGKADAAINRSFSMKTRQIVNVAVPHSGGSALATILLIPLFYILLPFIYVLGKIFNLASMVGLLRKKRGFTYGYNRIFWELRNNNPKLLADETKYKELAATFESRELPRPLSIEVNGTEDIAIRKASDDQGASDSSHSRYTNPSNTIMLIFRGTHPTVKEAVSPDDSIIILIASLLERYAKLQDYLLSFKTLFRAIELDGNIALIAETVED